MNEFGGKWTQDKIDIFMKYVPAYLTIMNKYKSKYNWELLYFDGFAGSGAILSEQDTDEKGNELSLVEGVATRVLEIDTPCRFDHYIFVEKNPDNAEKLRSIIQEEFPEIKDKTRVYDNDFNARVQRITSRMIELKKNPSLGNEIKALFFIDPYGMSVEWDSIASMKHLGIDMWILIPTGIGVNRLLAKNIDKVSDAWLDRLSSFFGLSTEQILESFYKPVPNLFGEDEMVKLRGAIKQAHLLYEEKLKTIFEYVSPPYVMENSRGSIMYHFLLASNNANAVKIATDITGKGIVKIK